MPMWLSVVQGNWFLTGAIARKIAGDVRSNLDLWSGAIDTLELEDHRRVKVKIFNLGIFSSSSLTKRRKSLNKHFE